ncbi:MAG: hypothetical protein AB1543_06130 [Candidatus Bipolaricaulota bacterium]
MLHARRLSGVEKEHDLVACTLGPKEAVRITSYVLEVRTPQFLSGTA